MGVKLSHKAKILLKQKTFFAKMKEELKMKNTIYCKTMSKGVHSFYLKVNGKEYLLFTQSYRRGVNDYFKKGICIEQATDFGRSKFDSAVMRTMSKIFMYVKYIEKEYDIQILKQTIKRNKKLKTKIYA